MNRAAVACVLVALLPALPFAQTKPNATLRIFRASGGERVVILAVGETGESRGEFYNSGRDKLCSADYSSADGDHGYVVAKAEWTPDQRYFVYSLESSGGHSVMSTPTQFFSLPDQSLCSLDSYAGELPIEFADFGLSQPNTVEVIVNGSDKPVRVALGLIDAKAPNKIHGCVPCKGGVVHDFGDQTPYEHSPN